MLALRKPSALPVLLASAPDCVQPLLMLGQLSGAQAVSDLVTADLLTGVRLRPYAWHSAVALTSAPCSVKPLLLAKSAASHLRKTVNMNKNAYLAGRVVHVKVHQRIHQADMLHDDNPEGVTKPGKGSKTSSAIAANAPSIVVILHAYCSVPSNPACLA